LFVALALVFIALMIWLLPKLWRAIVRVFRRLGQWLSPTPQRLPAPPPEPLLRLPSANAS
jgi:hypothetical protein